MTIVARITNTDRYIDADDEVRFCEEAEILLSELLLRAGLGEVARPPHDVDVLGISLDSRTVRSGDLFIAMSGMSYDGTAFLDQAQQAGAIAAIVSRPIVRSDNFPLILVDGLDRSIVADIVLSFYGDISKQVGLVGITGTNGKTTTAQLIVHVLNQAGKACGVIGTLNGDRTTPESPELFRRIKEEIEHGARYIAMEVSSIALDQGRVKNLEFLTSVFTNLSQDHLDYHKSMSRYFQSKALLFVSGASKTGIINRDCSYGKELLKRAEIRMIGIGRSDVTNFGMDSDGISFDYRGVHFDVPLLGEHNLYNALSAITAANMLGLTVHEIAVALRSFPGVPGRLEKISGAHGERVYVDYAHSPDALMHVMSALRNTMKPNEKLIVVFGAGGNRDRTKRAQMGYLAAKHADILFITNDNPRSEDPVSIANSIVDGILEAESNVPFEIVYDRRRAIFDAIAQIGERNVVLVAGKGHEKSQTIGGSTVYFSDVEVAREALAKLEFSEGAG